MNREQSRKGKVHHSALHRVIKIQNFDVPKNILFDDIIHNHLT